jgi:hypothetical protein
LARDAAAINCSKIDRFMDSPAETDSGTGTPKSIKIGDCSKNAS